MPLTTEEMQPLTAVFTELPPPEKAVEFIADALVKAQAAIRDAQSNGAVLLSRAEEAETQLGELETELTEVKAEKEKLALARTGTEPDPEVLADRADVYLQRIDVMVDRGDMPAFVAEKLKARVMPGGKPSAVMLSRAPDDGVRPIEFDLSLFDGSGLGLATGGKAALSRASVVPVVTGDKSKDDQPDPARMKELKELAGIPTE